MNQTMKSIHKELEQVVDLIGFLSEQEHCSQIDIDIALQRMRNAYELLIQVKKSYSDATQVIEQPKIPEPEMDVEESQEEVKQDIIEENQTEEKSVEEVNIETKQAIVSEKFKQGKTSVNESLKSQEKNLAAKLNEKPVMSISSAIGVNDRFLYVKELFNNDTELYTATLAKLDNFSNFEEAQTYINRYFDWDTEKGAGKQLLSIIRRKFIQ